MKSTSGERTSRRKTGSWANPPVRCALLSLALAALLQLPAQAGEVTAVRVALHGPFVRVVFDASGPVAADQPVLDSPTVVLLPMPGTTVQAGAAGFWKPRAGIESIRFYDWNLVTVARISVPFPVADTRLFALQSPNRVVLDLYPNRGELPVGPPLESKSASGQAGLNDGPETSAYELATVPAEASSVPLSDWLSDGGLHTYRSAVVLLGLVVLSGALAYGLLTFRRSRGWNHDSHPGPATSDSEIELMELDSMIRREMNRYERLSRLEQSR